MSLMTTVTEKLPPVFLVEHFVTKKNYLCYLYIGEDTTTINQLDNNFQTGYAAADLPSAAKMLLNIYSESERLPDVIFIDIPYQASVLKDFCLVLKSNVLLSSLPLIYSEKQLSDTDFISLKRAEIVDDIMKVDSPTVNFFNKILFIRQFKLYNHHNQLAQPLRKQVSVRMGVSTLLKRCIDVSVAGSCLLVLSPVLAIIALAIRLESKGPVIYTALRAGKGYRVFKFYKFRSMVRNAEKDVEKLSALNQYQNDQSGAVFFKVSNDPRITPLGRILRNTSIDEIPQLLNVLKGDMSLVGNRPLPLYEAMSLTTNDFVERFCAPAGITGLWQFNKRGKANMSTEERIKLDITYSRKCNVLYDLKILAKTPVALLQKSDV